MVKKTAISHAKLMSLLNKDKHLLLVDVRNQDEYNRGHIPGALNIPIEAIEAGNFNPGSEQMIVTICNGGSGRSERAAKFLRDKGFDQSFFLQGGTLGWFKD